MGVFKLDSLPYALDALAPHISKETLEYHYGKHHQTYVDKLNAAVENTPLKDLTLEEIVKGKGSNTSVTQGIYNAAAQTWNHTFYWNSMSPNQGGHREPTGKLMQALEQHFGSYDAFKKKFSDVAAGHFASGWAWLVKENGSNKLQIIDTHDAGSAIESKSSRICNFFGRSEILSDFSLTSITFCVC